MSVLEEIKAEVAELAAKKEFKGKFPEAKAFGYWFLDSYEEMSAEEAKTTIVDGPWDHGRDAVHFDEETGVLRIYQFKYSEDESYVFKGFSDLQNGVAHEKPNLSKAKALRIFLVTIANAGPAFVQEHKHQQQLIKKWLSQNGLKHLTQDFALEIVDLKKFQQASDRIVGIEVTLNYAVPPRELDGALYGLVDVQEFAKHVEKDELLAFNIRKFLGIRKGSVNDQIRDSLKDEGRRQNFWKYNNGIVCLCTEYSPAPAASVAEATSVSFKNLTVVNGAQTINTTAKWLSENKLADQPIYVMSKIIQVDEKDIEMGRQLTKSSNSQTPAEDRDLRSLDPQHKKLSKWLQTDFEVLYIYRRGGKKPKGVKAVKMKDLAQGYTAFWDGRPHTSFAQPGTLFTEGPSYEKCFPRQQVEEIERKGDHSARRTFVLQRLIAHDLLIATRQFLSAKLDDEEDEDELKWASLSYHLVWLLHQMLDRDGFLSSENLEAIHKAVPAIASNVLPEVYDATHDKLSEEEIPKVLKTKDVLTTLGDKTFFKLSHMKIATKNLHNCLAPLQPQPKG